jgi:type VI secretion system protein ImpG
MDQRLLAYYNRELQYLRELGGEFAKQFPKIAGRLGLEAFECIDPYVERLLEGFAFLAARIQLKIDAEFPRFTEHLLDMVYPHYLAPTPSMAVVRLEPNPRQGVLTDGFVVPRGTNLRSNLGKGQQTPCVYQTAHELSLWPLEISAVTHTSYVGDLGELGLRSSRTIRGSLRLRLRTTDGAPFQRLALNHLPMFIHGPDQISMRLYELLRAGSVALLLRPPDASFCEIVDRTPIRPLGFEDTEALLPCPPKSFQGYRLLQEYFALPQRFLFIELSGLSPGIRRCTANEIEVIVLLDRHDAVVETGLAPSHLALFCTPAVNLFARKADRIHLSESFHEYHVVPDRTRPADLEVHSITGVVGFGASTEMRRVFRPFYSSTDDTAVDDEPAYYTVHRQATLLSSQRRQTGPRSSYMGGEVFVALVDGDEGPYHTDLRQLSVDTLCTNRDLPLSMPVGQGRSDFHLETGAPVESARCIVGPTPPRASHAWGGTAWRLISHLSLNYLSITNTLDGQGASALREMLQLYGDLSEPTIRRQIDGIRSISSKPIVRRLPVAGPASFGRGLEILVSCDETAFEGTSAFLLGCVLDRFFSKYVSINSFTETVLHSTQRGEIMRWPARIGGRPIA